MLTIPAFDLKEFPGRVQNGWRAGRLAVRPGPPQHLDETPWADGGDGGGSVLVVPATLRPGPAPLVVLLHGATSTPQQVLPLLLDQADRRGLLLLAPKSADYTWDLIRGGFGSDVGRLDGALAAVFDQYEVDPTRIAIAGFSDGASYALSVGLGNGQLFRHVMAFSPGFLAPGPVQGRPSIFISHGEQDAVLPIDRCSRKIVPLLRRGGYEIDYREFTGGHEVSQDLVGAALDVLDRPAGSRAQPVSRS